MFFEKIKLEDDEVILTMLRRHWFYLFVHSVPVILVAIVPPIIMYVSSLLFAESVQLMTSAFIPYMLFLYALLLLCIWMILASIWTNYYLDIWCVTNKRIIKVDQAGLFRRKMGSFRLERMQDVNVEINGIIATLLNYGSVHVQTASAELEEFKASFLPNPQGIKSIILSAADELLLSGSTKTVI